MSFFPHSYAESVPQQATEGEQRPHEQHEEIFVSGSQRPRSDPNAQQTGLSSSNRASADPNFYHEAVRRLRSGTEGAPSQLSEALLPPAFAYHQLDPSHSRAGNTNEPKTSSSCLGKLDSQGSSATPSDMEHLRSWESHGWQAYIDPPRGQQRVRLPTQEYIFSDAIHRRFASTSSGSFAGDERPAMISDKESDAGSELSELLSCGIPPDLSALDDMSGFQDQAHLPGIANYDELTGQKQFRRDLAAPLSVPEYLLDELKTLKLENLALRKLAEELVGLCSAYDARSESQYGQATQSCPIHPPHTDSTLLEALVHGRDDDRNADQQPSLPMQSFAVASQPRSPCPPRMVSHTRSQARQGQTSGAGAASGDFVSSIGPQSRPVRTPATQLRSREASPMPLYASTPAFVSSSRTGTPIDIGRRVPPSTSALPSRLQPRSLESTPPMQPSPEASPSPASLQRLYGLDASMLVAMILDKRGQDASLLLQQQLKSGGPDKQNEIYDAVRRHLLCLAQDRHGNFLVQRTIEARPQTAWDLSGSFVDLTLSQFGSHVVQKILEGDEKIREQVAEELMGAKLEQTLTSRNSIHVWQRILEAEWRRGEFRERIFASINAQLAGKWAQTARQETGSIICQNIFESAHEDEKRPCMHEVLDELDRCASNQWGVWVVQHIIEHGTDEDRKAALRKLLGSAATLALSPYGQKAIMSGLKTRDPFFVEEFVSALCQSSGARRPPLIDVCLSPHGIQIVTQLLTTVRQEIRDRIISTVRRNSVFLKGSKTGMKVHQLCERARAFAGY